MMKTVKLCLKLAFLFLIGGTIYIYVEMFWRGHSHISMFILGGVCFVAIGLINEIIPWDMGLLWQALIGAVIITLLEFVTGLIVNVWLGLGVWDYSNLPLNILGQISLPYSFAWIILAAVAILLDDYIRYEFFDEKKPSYKIL